MTNATIDRRLLLTGGLALSAALLVAPTKVLAQGGPSVEEVLYDPAAPVMGNPQGDVTLLEFFDYQCPFCRRSFPEYMNLVESDGNIRFVMKDWPILSEASVRAAKMTLAGGSQRTPALRALMGTTGRISDEIVDRTIRSAGVDPAALEADYQRNRQAIDALLARNNAQAEAFGLMGTPAYLVDTMLFPGVPQMSDIREAIQRARA